jgi:hypothetical protein
MEEAGTNLNMRVEKMSILHFHSLTLRIFLIFSVYFAAELSSGVIQRRLQVIATKDLSYSGFLNLLIGHVEGLLGRVTGLP